MLEAAGEVFAERGFRDATVRDICALAGANVAAVNYHFRDKEGLYRAVLEYAASLALAKHPPSRGVPEGAAAEVRLEGFIRNFLERLLDSGRPAWHGNLICREMVDPTGVMDDLLEHFVRPQFLRLREIMTELLSPVDDEGTIWRCACSVVGQCLFYRHARPVVERLRPEQGFDEAARAELTRHITEFSLAAVRGVGRGT